MNAVDCDNAIGIQLANLQRRGIGANRRLKFAEKTIKTPRVKYVLLEEVIVPRQNEHSAYDQLLEFRAYFIYGPPEGHHWQTWLKFRI